MERPDGRNKPCNYCGALQKNGNCNKWGCCDPYKGWLNASFAYWRNKLGVKGKDVMK